MLSSNKCDSNAMTAACPQTDNLANAYCTKGRHHIRTQHLSALTVSNYNNTYRDIKSPEHAE